MSQSHEFLKKMISLPGLSAHEQPIRQLIQGAWEPLTDELSVRRIDRLHGERLFAIVDRHRAR